MSNQQSTQDHDDSEQLGNDNNITALPSFAPPEAVKALQEAHEQKAAALAETSVPPADENTAAIAGAAGDAVTAEAESEAAEKPSPEKVDEPEAQAEAKAPEDAQEVPAAASPPAAGDAEPAAFVFTPDTVEAALRGVSDKVMAERGAAASNPIDAAMLAGIAERLNLNSAISEPGSAHALTPGVAGQHQAVATVPMTSGQRSQVSGGSALVEGLGMAAGGAMAVVGAAARVVGRAGHGIASLANNALDGAPKTSAQAESVQAPAGNGLSPVLPRLSEYRIIQAEKAADLFAHEQEKFWQVSPKLVALHGEIDRIARERGVPKQDLMEEMKPGGDLAALRTQFNEAVAENPEALTHKRSMDKALDSYVRQYGRAQEEMLNPEQAGNPHYEGLKSRLNANHKKMEDSAAEMPAFAKADGELDKAHFEKLREAVAAIMTKIREVIQEFTKLLTGKREVEHAPAP